MHFPETIAQIKTTVQSNEKIWSTLELLIEDVGYQAATIQLLEHEGFDATGVKIASDKRSRLMSVSSLIQSGKIRFARHGNEELVRQIVGFGIERHDDLVDAFTIVGHKAITNDGPVPALYI